MRRDAEEPAFRRAGERVGNVDGAPWIKRQIEKRLEMTAAGLDFYHFADTIHKSMCNVFGGENKEAQLNRLPKNLRRPLGASRGRGSRALPSATEKAMLIQINHLLCEGGYAMSSTTIQLSPQTEASLGERASAAGEDVVTHTSRLMETVTGSRGLENLGGHVYQRFIGALRLVARHSA